jgi:hypothetical protein
LNIHPYFDGFPQNAQRALFDMIYNLGPGRRADKRHHASGLRRYNFMNKAIDEGKWPIAAKLCLRRGIPPDRNRWTADLFLSCVPHLAGK